MFCLFNLFSLFYLNRHLKHHKNFKYLEIFRTLTDDALAYLRAYMPEIKINTKLFSTIARPTTGNRRTAIWGLKVRDRDPQDPRY